MALVLVTGLSGTGKSAVLRQLVLRGLEAYGFDEDRFGEWFDTRTGRPTEFPRDRRPDDTAHLEFRVHRDRLEQLAVDASGRTIFLCGGASHEFEFWELLDTVIYLSADDATLTRRLAERTDNGYGKAPGELAGILEANQTFEAMYRSHGAHVVDAAAPIVQIVDEVLHVAGNVSKSTRRASTSKSATVTDDPSTFRSASK